MRRHLNFTGRKRIPRSMFSIALQDGNGGAPTFVAHLDLSKLDVPGNARIFIEAFYKQSVMRFDFGTVAEISPPANTRLTELDAREHVQFRIKVVEPEVGGRILAAADRIRAELKVDDVPAGKESILPVDFPANMGEVLWRLNFEDVTGPVLELNSRVADVRNMARNHPIFFGFVYPAVVQGILNEIVHADDYEEDMAFQSDWRGKWLRFAAQLGQTEPPTSDSPPEERDAWISEVVASFAQQTRAVTRYIEWEQVVANAN